MVVGPDWTVQVGDPCACACEPPIPEPDEDCCEFPGAVISASGLVNVPNPGDGTLDPAVRFVASMNLTGTYNVAFGGAATLNADDAFDEIVEGCSPFYLSQSGNVTPGASFTNPPGFPNPNLSTSSNLRVTVQRTEGTVTFSGSAAVTIITQQFTWVHSLQFALSVQIQSGSPVVTNKVAIIRSTSSGGLGTPVSDGGFCQIDISALPVLTPTGADTFDLSVSVSGGSLFGCQQTGNNPQSANIIANATAEGLKFCDFEQVQVDAACCNFPTAPCSQLTPTPPAKFRGRVRSVIDWTQRRWFTSGGCFGQPVLQFVSGPGDFEEVPFAVDPSVQPCVEFDVATNAQSNVNLPLFAGNAVNTGNCTLVQTITPTTRHTTNATYLFDSGSGQYGVGGSFRHETPTITPIGGGILEMRFSYLDGLPSSPPFWLPVPFASFRIFGQPENVAVFDSTTGDDFVDLMLDRNTGVGSGDIIVNPSNPTNRRRVVWDAGMTWLTSATSHGVPVDQAGGPRCGNIPTVLTLVGSIEVYAVAGGIGVPFDGYLMHSLYFDLRMILDYPVIDCATQFNPPPESIVSSGCSGCNDGGTGGLLL